MSSKPKQSEAAILCVGLLATEHEGSVTALMAND